MQSLNSNLCYYKYNNTCGISKIKKGVNNMSKTYEMRIHLDEEFLRIGTFPEFDLIAELTDKSKIDKQKKKIYFCCQAT